MKADINPLVGRKFVTASGNTGIFQRLGDGALRCSWAKKGTEQDMTEAEEFIKMVLGIPEVNFTVSIGKEEEADNLREWRKGNR